MARTLITSWSDCRLAVDQLLALAQHEIRVVDQDLGLLGLSSRETLAHLRRFLANKRQPCIRIALRDGAALSARAPLFTELLVTHGHLVSVQQTPEHLAGLRDAMVLIDDRHGLVRFDRDQPRAKLLIEEIDDLQPYVHRFDELWTEGGIPLSPRPLGL